MRILLRSARSLIDEALPEAELDEIRSRDPRARGRARRRRLPQAARPRRAGARRYVDVHVQFAAGTTLEAAHGTAHELTNADPRQLAGADVLVHVEPARPRQTGQPGRIVLEQVRSGRHADGERDRGVAAVVAQLEQDRGDQAGQHGERPWQPG